MKFFSIKIKKNFIVENIRPLNLAKQGDVTFFDNIKYKAEADNTKASACITTKNLRAFYLKKS